mgnify:CR=1 FL=1
MAITALLLTGCANKYKIPNVKFYAEIPFVDCPEGVYVELVTGKNGIISCEQWKIMRPTMIMLDPEGKMEAFNGWTEGCRYAGKNCVVDMKSVKQTIDKVDGITSKILKGYKK